MHPMFEVGMFFQRYRRIISMSWCTDAAFPVAALVGRRFYCPGREDEYWHIGCGADREFEIFMEQTIRPLLQLLHSNEEG